MPENPKPNFDFFAAPDVTTDRDSGDEAAPVYPTRDNDFDLREIDRLTEQLEQARHAYRAAYQALITNNPWRVEAVRDALRAIGATLGVE